MRTIGRILAIIGAYLAGCYVAGAVFMAILFNPFSDAAGGAGERIGTMLSMALVAGLAAAVIASVCALIPTVALIGYAERAGRRSLRFHAIAGALIGPLTFIIFVAAVGRGMPGFNDATWSVLALLGASLTAGIAGALAYWGLVGRNAGAWRSAAG